MQGQEEMQAGGCTGRRDCGLEGAQAGGSVGQKGARAGGSTGAGSGGAGRRRRRWVLQPQAPTCSSGLVTEVRWEFVERQAVSASPQGFRSPEK